MKPKIQAQVNALSNDPEVQKVEKTPNLSKNDVEEDDPSRVKRQNTHHHHHDPKYTPGRQAFDRVVKYYDDAIVKHPTIAVSGYPYEGDKPKDFKLALNYLLHVTKDLHKNDVKYAEFITGVMNRYMAKLCVDRYNLKHPGVAEKARLPLIEDWSKWDLNKNPKMLEGASLLTAAGFRSDLIYLYSEALTKGVLPFQREEIEHRIIGQITGNNVKLKSSRLGDTMDDSGDNVISKTNTNHDHEAVDADIAALKKNGLKKSMNGNDNSKTTSKAYVGDDNIMDYQSMNFVPIPVQFGSPQYEKGYQYPANVYSGNDYVGNGQSNGNWLITNVEYLSLFIGIAFFAIGICLCLCLMIAIVGYVMGKEHKTNDKGEVLLEAKVDEYSEIPAHDIDSEYV